MKKILFIIAIISCISISQLFAEEKTADFDFMIAVTQQNSEMDWWFAVPSEFGPKISRVGNISKGEYFKAIPIFRNYGVNNNDAIHITYNVTILNPNGTVNEQEKNCTGYIGQSTGPYLIPATQILMICFDPEDPFGEYTIHITAYDHIKDQKVKKTEKITLKKFSLPELKDDRMEWFFNYPSCPKPSKVIASFLNPHPRPYINNEGKLLWSALWFYKHVFDENEFLIPHTKTFFKEKATQQQKEDIILLFYLLNKTNELLLTGDLKKYSERIKTIKIPNPYSEIKTADQLDMLWGEFFATGRIKPIRQIISAFNLSKYEGTLEKVKTKKLDISNDQVKQEAMLEAVFGSALWSLGSNCKQSPLLFQYCVGLYESNELNETEKGYLGAVLKAIYEKGDLTNQSSESVPASFDLAQDSATSR